MEALDWTRGKLPAKGRISWIAVGAELRVCIRLKALLFFTVNAFGTGKHSKQSQGSWGIFPVLRGQACHLTLIRLGAIHFRGVELS